MYRNKKKKIKNRINKETNTKRMRMFNKLLQKKKSDGNVARMRPNKCRRLVENN